VARVLDGKSVRGPVARSFALGVFVGAVVVAAPLAALTFKPSGSALEPAAKSGSLAAREPGSGYYPGAPEVPNDVAHLIASGVSTSVATAAAAIAPVTVKAEPDFETVAPSGAKVVSKNGVMVATAPSGATATIYPADAQGRRRIVAVSASGAKAVTYVNSADVPGMSAAFAGKSSPNDVIESAIALKAIGATPEYIAAMRSVAPQLRLSNDDLVQLRSVGVTPDFVQELARAGYRAVDADEITSAYAVGVRSDYIRGMAAAGYPRLPLEDLTQLRAVGVTPADVQRYRRAGFSRIDVDDLVEMKTLGITPEELRASQRDDP